MSDSQEVLASAAHAASQGIVLQVAFRILTFVVNAVVLRFISADVLGVVNVRLLLLYSTIIFFSREPFRRACVDTSRTRNWKETLNVVWLCVPIGIAWSVGLALVWIQILQAPPQSDYIAGVLCYALAAVVELVGEPLAIMAQTRLFVSMKTMVEGIAISARAALIVTLVLTRVISPITAFGVAQIGYSASIVLGYIVLLRRKGHANNGIDSVREMLPFQASSGAPLLDEELLRLVWSFFKQSFFKQLLTEGERYLMTFFSIMSFAEQGVYDVINNLGSLVARFIFLQIEDGYYLFFSSVLSRESATKSQDLPLAVKTYNTLLALMTVIGLTIFCFGQGFSYLLLDLYGGSIVSAGVGPALLRAYCAYVFCIAVNGISESFVFAAMSTQALDRYTKQMTVFSGLFLVSSFLLTQYLGSIGFIFANCVNMLIRITHSVWFIRQYLKFSEQQVRWQPVSTTTLISYAIALVVTFSSYFALQDNYQNLQPRIIHVLIGMLSLVMIGWVFFVYEQNLCVEVFGLFLQRGKKKL